jgi:hypothetical protein
LAKPDKVHAILLRARCVRGAGEWMRPRVRNFPEQCCDCGLIHRLDSRIDGRRIEFRSAERVGRKPNDALFHAETTVLLRAAREKGGSLAGRTLTVHVDDKLCNNCQIVLPYVGLELGNPTVTFIDPNGLEKTMRDGAWVD